MLSKTDFDAIVYFKQTASEIERKGTAPRAQCPALSAALTHIISTLSTPFVQSHYFLKNSDRFSVIQIMKLKLHL
jgi:hypothetical protein